MNQKTKQNLFSYKTELKEKQVPLLWEPVLESGESISLLQYPLLVAQKGIRHCFTTRAGGVSEGIFSSMNLSFTRGDDEEAVRENYRRVAMVMGTAPERIVCSDQTHTTNVRLVTKEDAGKGVVYPKDYTDVDGLITNESGLMLGTFYADCVPLYFYDPVNHAIGLSHSGWRGTVNRMGKATLEAMAQAFGTKAKDVYCAIGPSICQDCYEVSYDVAEAFYREFCAKDDACAEDGEKKENSLPKQYQSKLLREKEPVDGERKFLLNLWEANYRVLTEAGVSAEKIETTSLCTCCNSDILFSHRASKGKRGNLGAFLMLLERE